MEGKFTYSREEVEAIVVKHHYEIMQAPEGYEWVAVENYGQVAVELLTVKEKEAE